jgi:hypothetical protein
LGASLLPHRHPRACPEDLPREKMDRNDLATTANPLDKPENDGAIAGEAG